MIGLAGVEAPCCPRLYLYRNLFPLTLACGVEAPAVGLGWVRLCMIGLAGVEAPCCPRLYLYRNLFPLTLACKYILF